MVLGDQGHPPIRQGPPDPLGEHFEEVGRLVVVQGVRGVQPQAVDVVLVEPVQGVLDEELLDLLAPLAVEVDAGGPGALPARSRYCLLNSVA